MGLVVLGIISVIVGILIGTVGIGGILLIPCLAHFADLSTHESMATALFSFTFTGLAGTWMFQLRRTIDWEISLPVCMGAVFFSYLGARVNAGVDPRILNVLLSLIILFSGVYTLYSSKGRGFEYLDGRSAAQRLLLLGTGAAIGFGSGLTGTGGPVLSVPVMVLMGFAPLTSIATSQVLQIAVASAGTLGNLQNGSVHLGLGLSVTVLELAGVVLGVRLAHSLATVRLRQCVAAVCVGVGLLILFRSREILLIGWELVLRRI